MHAYSIVIKNLPQKHLHPSIRHGFDDDQALMDVSLSVKGRPATNRSTTAWLESKELAEELVAYWRPQLEARWGMFEHLIAEEVADKWQQNWLITCSNAARQLLGGADHKAPRKSKGKSVSPPGRFLVIVTIDSRRLYYRGVQKRNIVFCSDILDAKRYKTREKCEAALADTGLKESYKAEVLQLTDQEAQEIERGASEARRDYWEFKRGGY